MIINLHNQYQTQFNFFFKVYLFFYIYIYSFQYTTIIAQQLQINKGREEIITNNSSIQKIKQESKQRKKNIIL